MNNWLITTYSHERGERHNNPYVTKVIGGHPLDYLRSDPVWKDARLIYALPLTDEEHNRWLEYEKIELEKKESKV